MIRIAKVLAEVDRRLSPLCKVSVDGVARVGDCLEANAVEGFVVVLARDEDGRQKRDPERGNRVMPERIEGEVVIEVPDEYRDLIPPDRIL